MYMVLRSNSIVSALSSLGCVHILCILLFYIVKFGVGKFYDKMCYFTDNVCLKK